MPSYELCRKPYFIRGFKEPSVEAFAGFDKTYGVKQGKFIRVSGLILVAPLVKLAENGKRPTHLDMIWGGVQHPNQELADRVRMTFQEADPAKGLSRRDDLADAGHYRTHFTESGLLTLAHIEGESLDFGRADEDGRAETVDIMRIYIPVTTVEVTGA